MVSLIGPSSFCEQEEFYIVTTAPVAVGGGIIRHYLHTENGLVSTRYSYVGMSSDTIFIEKTTDLLGKAAGSGGNDIDKKELIKIPVEDSGKMKKGRLQIGSHDVLLTLNRYGRISAREAN